MQIPYVNLINQHKVLRDEILAAIDKVLSYAMFILGEEISQFEEAFAKYCGCKFAIGVNSGTDALFLSMKALDIGPGDEVITVPNSFITTASSIATVGARPVFVDVEENGYNIDATLIEKAITTHTKAILPVHLTGRPAEMDTILDIAARYGLNVIEDAAQAVGAEYKGQKVGSFGTTGCFSLHPLKTLNACGDGGVITTNDEKLYQRIYALRKCGLKTRDESDEFGYNSRLDSLQAAILNVKLKYVDEWNSKRRENAKYYTNKLQDVALVPPERADEKAVYHTYVIRAKNRDALQSYLKNNGIDTKIHYPIPIHLQKAAEYLGYKRGDFLRTEQQAEEILSLPIYPELTIEQMNHVVETIHTFYKR